MIHSTLNPVVLAHFIIIQTTSVALWSPFRWMKMPGSWLMIHRCLVIEQTNADLNLGWLRHEWVLVTALLLGQAHKQSPAGCGHTVGMAPLSAQVRRRRARSSHSHSYSQQQPPPVRPQAGALFRSCYLILIAIKQVGVLIPILPLSKMRLGEAA